MIPATKTIKSLASYIEWLNAKWHLDASVTWFRGERDERWNLDPGLLRKTYRENPKNFERRLLEVHQCYGPSLCDSYPAAWLDQIVLMQHRGCPTRLLDWTESALVALYFAVNRLGGCKDDECDGSVYMLSPLELTKSQPEDLGQGRIASGPDLRRIGIEAIVECEDESPSGANPIPFVPEYIDRRILAQKGRFTLHPLIPDLLERFSSNADPTGLSRVRVPWDKKRSLHAELATAGITETTLFPDLDALSRELRIMVTDGVDVP